MGNTLTAQQEHDLTNPLYYGANDPEPILAILRKEEPVYWTTGLIERGFWSVTRHADARYVYGNDRGDDALLSSRQYGPMLPLGMNWEKPKEGDIMWLFQAGAQMSVLDGERHELLRGPLSKRFTPGAVLKLEELIRTLVVDVLNSVIEKGECDFANDVAGILPLTLISNLMDVPKDDWSKLYHWTYMSTAPADPEFSVGTPEETAAAGLEGINNYCRDLALERRGQGGDDLVSILADIKIHGEYLSDLELGFNGSALYSAGHETTRNALCGGLEEMLGNNRGEWERLREHRYDKSVMQRAADEMVRWSSPLTHQMRTARHDFTLGDKQIKAGDWVVIWNNSANRDESVFADPYRFNGSRSPNPHLGFASGSHFCLGAHLARIEMRIMLEYLLEYMPDLELAGGSETAASLLFRGIKRQPMRFKPKQRIAS